MEHPFEWDEDKNESNRRKHGLSFEEAREIFAGPVLTAVDDRAKYGEERLISIGLMLGVVAIVVVHVERSGVIRIISARKAGQKERRDYHEYLERTA